LALLAALFEAVLEVLPEVVAVLVVPELVELDLDPSSRFAFQGREPSLATGWR
jgi:hypothetical protein